MDDKVFIITKHAVDRLREYNKKLNKSTELEIKEKILYYLKNADIIDPRKTIQFLKYNNISTYYRYNRYVIVVNKDDIVVTIYPTSSKNKRREKIHKNRCGGISVMENEVEIMLNMDGVNSIANEFSRYYDTKEYIFLKLNITKNEIRITPISDTIKIILNND